MIKFKSLELLGLAHRIPGKIENAVYDLELSAFVLEIFTDVVIHSIQYNIKYINRAISA